jgi:hypothetical protein
MFLWHRAFDNASIISSAPTKPTAAATIIIGSGLIALVALWPLLWYSTIILRVTREAEGTRFVNIALVFLMRAILHQQVGGATSLEIAQMNNHQ